MIRYNYHKSYVDVATLIVENDPLVLPRPVLMHEPPQSAAGSQHVRLLRSPWDSNNSG